MKLKLMIIFLLTWCKFGSESSYIDGTEMDFVKEGQMRASNLKILILQVSVAAEKALLCHK